MQKMNRYFYLSPNGTPWACTYYRGYNKNEQIRADIRKMHLGHGFNTTLNWGKLRAINEKFDSFRISEEEISRYPYPDGTR
jgi:hypothetical protein